MRLPQVFNAVMAGLVASLVAAAASILVLMFSHPEPGRSVGLFGAVYFEASRRTDGSISLGLGVENWMMILTVWLGLSALALAAILVARRRFTLGKRT